MAFRRDLVLELGGFDHVLGAGRPLAGAEDLDMFCRILDAGHAIVHDPACVIHHMNTREGDSYTELHLGYGLGLGALANKLVRLRFTVGLALLAVLAQAHGRPRACATCAIPARAAPTRAMFRGIRQGFVAGARMRISRERRSSTSIRPHRPRSTNTSTETPGGTDGATRGRVRS